MRRDRDEYLAKFSELCNWFWYQSHSDYPRDLFTHTSDVCRRWAHEVFELLGIEEEDERDNVREIDLSPSDN